MKIKQPSPLAVKIAKKIDKEIDRLRRERTELTYSYSAGDWFGPSISDFKDAEEMYLFRLAKLIDKELS